MGERKTYSSFYNFHRKCQVNLLFSKALLYLLILCPCLCLYWLTGGTECLWMYEDNLCFLLYHAGPRNTTQVVRLCGRHLTKWAILPVLVFKINMLSIISQSQSREENDEISYELILFLLTWWCACRERGSLIHCW